MSRCFPFDSSAYDAKKRSSNDALIVSIKLQEDRKNSTIPDRLPEEKRPKSSDKEKKDHRKREKTDKKKDRKDKKRDHKDKLHSAVEGEKQQKQQLKQTDKLFVAESFGKESEGKLSCERLERSNLTEEHGRPVDTQNVSCSSDSTGNSGKRKRHSSPASTIQGTGNIIRIKLSSQKRDDPGKSKGELRPLIKAEPPACPAEVIPKVVKPVLVASTSAATLQLVPTQDNSRLTLNKKVEPLVSEEGPSTSGRVESKEQPSKKLSSHEKKILRRASLYNELFQNLTPPALVTAELVADQVDDEDDWLKPAKKLRGGDECSTQACTDRLPCSTSSLLQPCAHFLSDVGVYALPFTVPF